MQPHQKTSPEQGYHPVEPAACLQGTSGVARMTRRKTDNDGYEECGGYQEWHVPP